MIERMKRSFRPKPISKHAGARSLRSYSDLIAIAVLLGSAAFVYRAYLGTTGYVLLPTFYPYYIDPVTLSWRYFGSSWNHGLLGLPLLFYVAGVPFHSLITILSVLVGPEPLSRILSPLFVFLTTCACYGFLRKGLGTRPLPSLLAALFVGYNPWGTNYVQNPTPSLDLIFTIISAYIGLYSTLTYFRSEKIFYGFVAGLTSLSSLSFPPGGIIVTLSTWLLALVLIIERTSDVDKTRLLRNYVTFFGIQVFALSPVIINLAWSVADSGPALTGNASSFLENITAANSMALVFPYPLLALQKYIVEGSALPYVILNLVMVIVASFALLRISQKFNTLTIYAATLFIISSFLLKGINEPFPQVYIAIKSLLPVLQLALRNPLHFMVSSTLALSMMLAIGVERIIAIFSQLSSRIKPKVLRRSMFILMFCLLWVIPGTYTGYNIINNPVPGVIPQYYGDAIHFLSNKYQADTFRLFIPGTLGANYYDWFLNHFETPVLADLFPAITYYSYQGLGIVSGEYYELPKLVKELPAADPAIPEILGMMNVRYIIIQNDFAPAPYYNPVPDLERASSFHGVEKLNTFGKIEVLANSRFKPNIFIPNILIPVNSTDSLVESARMVTLLNLSINSAYVSSDLLSRIASSVDASNYRVNVSKDQYMNIFQIKSVPNITTVSRINYDEYIVKVTNITGPFILILGDAYSPLWSVSAKVPQGELRAYHFLANEYANAWLISTPSSSLEISVIYGGKTYLYASYVLFTLYMLIAASFLVTSLMSKLSSAQSRHGSSFHGAPKGHVTDDLGGSIFLNSYGTMYMVQSFYASVHY